jgi:Zn-dependent peptidase ImmA (M78 family)/transcriptional regulator with XRE-family HTH domain
VISSQQLGERLADARKRAKLTQADVADRMGLARTTLVAIEKGERRPSDADLVRLGEILNSSIHDLLRETFVRAELSPRFRIRSGADQEPIEEALERLRGFGARYAELEKLHGLTRMPARLEVLSLYRSTIGALSAGLDAHLSGEDAARSVRGLLGLGDEPALRLEERFEIEAGLRIFRLDRLPPWLAAMLMWSDELGGCIAINADHPPEKQRWSLAHEVAHLLWDPEAGDVLDERDARERPEESFTEGFTTELLLPAGGVKKRFADRCRAGKFTPVDVFALARLFEVPFEALARRLEELRLLPKGSYDRIARIQPGKPLRPGALRAEHRFPERYVALALAAHDRELLSEGELAAYLDTDIADARHVYQEHQRIRLDDGSQLAVDFAAGDLRTA